MVLSADPWHYWVILDPKSKEDKVKVTNLKHLPKVQMLEFWSKLYMQHTFWSCFIRCVNMKFIRRVLLKIQSGHYSVHRRTRWNQYTPPPPPSTSLSGGIKNRKTEPVSKGLNRSSPWYSRLFLASQPTYPENFMKIYYQLYCNVANRYAEAPRWETVKQSRQVWNSLDNYFLGRTSHFMKICSPVFHNITNRHRSRK